MPSIFFFHGLESGPHGSKYRALREKFEVTSPDYQGMNDVEERLAHAAEATEGLTGQVIVGSSFGGLVAALLAHRHPERVGGYVLCAPALHQEAAKEIARVPEHVVIIHGRQDDIVPYSASEEFCDRFDVPLIGVDDGHRLAESRDLIVEKAGEIQGKVGS